MSNIATGLLQSQFESAHNWLEGTISGMPPEQLHWNPQGLTSSAGVQYMHVLTVEDLFVSILKGEPPLLAGAFADKMGVDKMPPEGVDWLSWGKEVKIDLPTAQGYGKAIYQMTHNYLGSISDDDLNQEVDLSPTGAGTQTRAWVFNVLLLNAYSHTGEISAIKGLQGEQGYPV